MEPYTNTYFENLIENNKYYKSLKRFDKERLEEPDLERELYKERNYIENELNNLEKELYKERNYIENELNNLEKEFNYNYQDNDLLNGTIYRENNSYLLSNNDFNENIMIIEQTIDKYNCVFKIPCIDIIKTIYLQVDFPYSFDEIPLHEIMKFFSYYDISFIIGDEISSDRKIDTTSLLILTLLNKFKNIFVKENDNIIQFPLYDFQNCDIDCEINGLPVFGKNEMKILVHSGKQINCKLIIEYYMCSNSIINKLSMNKYQFPIIQSQYICGEIYYDNIDIFSRNCYSKCLIFNFRFIENYIDFLNPEIYSVTLKINNNKEIVFDYNEILTEEIFGIKMFIIPLSKEFSSWDNITQLMEKPEENITSSFEQPISMSINGSDDIYGCVIKLYNVNINFIKVESGICSNCLKYQCNYM